MTRMRRLGACCAMLVLGTAGAGCGDILGGGRASSSFQASLAFSEGGTHAYAGEGDFYVGPNAAEGLGMRFDLSSEDSGADGWERFYLHRRGDGIPHPGAYALTALDLSDAAARGATVLYIRRQGETVEHFRAHAGEFQVTRSSARRVEGTFRFTAFRYCVSRPGGVQEGPCAPVGGVVEGAPTIEVTGSFSAVPMDADAIEDASAVVPIP